MRHTWLTVENKVKPETLLGIGIEYAQRSGQLLWEQRRRLAAGALLGMVLAPAVATQQESIEQFGGHTSVISPTIDGHLTIAEGALGEGRLEIDTPLGLGAHIRLGPTSLSPGQLPDEYLQLFLHSDGEITHAKEVVARQLRQSVLVAFIGGELLAFTVAAGVQKLTSRPRAALATGALACATALGGMPPLNTSQTPEAYSGWEPLSSMIGDEDMDYIPSQLQPVEIKGTLLRVAIAQAWPLYKEKFIVAKEFYRGLETGLQSQAYRVAPRQDGEVRVVFASDRHDNIAMDASIAQIIGLNQAEIVGSLGDDTSSGNENEAFSINSLATKTKNAPHRFQVDGNHDSLVTRQLFEKSGFVNANTQKVISLAGLTIMGTADPRHSSLGMRMQNGEKSMSQVAAELKQAACSRKQPVDLLVVHDYKLAEPAVRSGCAKLSVSGHYHSATKPETITTSNGRPSVRITMGTTGGAEDAISWGPLSVDANILVAGFMADSAGVMQLHMLQSYNFYTNGTVAIADPLFYVPIATETQKTISPEESIPRGNTKE
jgi:predicted phosphodiesterase